MVNFATKSPPYHAFPTTEQMLHLLTSEAGLIQLENLMDPEVTYQQMIEWAQQISDGEDQLDDDALADLLYDVAPQLANMVLFLDGWLRKDGFPPEAWEQSLQQSPGPNDADELLDELGIEDDYPERQGTARTAHTETDFNNLDEFTQAYIEAAFFSSHDESDDSGGDPLDQYYAYEDIAQECWDTMVEDCRRFQEESADVLAEAEYLGSTREPASDSEMAGYDFWMTRNGHGVGFWDGDWSEPHGDLLDEASQKFGETHLYVGDDGQIYCQAG